MKLFIGAVALMAALTAPAMAADVAPEADYWAENSGFGIKMKDAGFRWTQDTDNLDNFWGSTANQNGLRLFTTAYVGSKSHEIGFMYEQNAIGAAWDVFNSRDSIDEQVMVEYRYNFDQ